jgi:hypothetical protein
MGSSRNHPTVLCFSGLWLITVEASSRLAYGLIRLIEYLYQ